jgi:hypothetical protein
MLAGEPLCRKAQSGDLCWQRIREEARNPLCKGGFRELTGSENIFLTKTDVIESVFRRLEPAICARCDKRMFPARALLPAPCEARGNCVLDLAQSWARLGPRRNGKEQTTNLGASSHA